MTRALCVVLALTAIAAAHPPGEDRVRIPKPKHPRPPALIVPGERLPRPFVPTAYRLRISVEDKLVGAIAIDGTVAAPTSAIWLDFQGTVTAAAARHGAELVPLQVTVKDDRIALEPPSPLAPGAWSIEIIYTAKIADDGKVQLPPDGPRDPIPEQLAAGRASAVGAFRETVDDAAYVFTQSEPMDARRIFPCIDEPDLKVPWLLTLDVDDKLVAASNAPITAETALPDHRKRVAFAQTQPLPSYLVAFVVGPFDVIDAGVAKSGAHLRILETRGHAAPWAAATAARVLDLTAAWTGIPYAYEKLDLVAVPRTGAHWAAMENPGLVTFADWVIRPDEKNREQKERWVAIAAHEFAHQWFGDLVTTAWWNDIWLNESFAVWVAREVATQFDPAYATTADKAYPDFVEIARPAPGGTNYLAYFAGGRGARALAMFNELLGPAKFQSAIHAYLVAHAHGNAVTADLAAALSAAYGAPLEPALIAAIDRPSIPDVAVRATCESIDVTASEPTPVCVAYEDRGKRAKACALVEKTASFPVASCPRWVVPNADGAMRYTTHQSPTDLARASFGWDVLSSPERAAILDETGPDLALALRLVDAPDARAWAAETIAKAARLSPVPIARWLRAHYLARAKKLDLATADRDDAAVLDAIAEAGDPDLERAAAELVTKHFKEIHADVLGAVTRLALRADPKLVDQLLAALDRAFFERRRALLRTLSQVPDVLAHAASLPTLTPGDRLVLLAETCDPARRAEAQEVASGLSDGAYPILRAFNACLDRRERTIATWGTVAR